MDNISEPRTEVESIVAAPSNNESMATTTINTSISQEPIFDGGANRELLQSYDENEEDLNVIKIDVILHTF